MPAARRLFTALAALSLAAGVTVALAPAASAAPASLYAYPGGAATSPTSCPQATDLAAACSLADALKVAASGDKVLLAADPGTGDTATFSTDTGWTVDQEVLYIASDDGVAATLDGRHTAPYLLKFTGTTLLQVTGSIGSSADASMPITIENSAGSGDPSGPGGGVVNVGSGAVTVVAATIRDNVANGGVGGGIVNVAGGTVGTNMTTLSGNVTGAGGTGGGIVNVGAGVVSANSSTFVGNDASGGGHGGGISAAGSGPVRVITSTFTANTTSAGGGTTGGGIHSAAGDLSVVDSTFTANEPGLAATSASVAGSLFAANTPDCAGTVTDSGYNMDSDGTCGFTPATHSASHVTTLPGTLNPLGDNGGLTETIAPQLNSPAVGFVPATATVTLSGPGSFPLCAQDQTGTAPASNGRPCNAGSLHHTVGGEHQTPVTLHAYPSGAAYWPTDCPVASDLAAGCDLTDALRLAQSKDTVELDADPGTGDTATFTTDTGWTVGVESLTITAGAGVAATLDGQHTAPFVVRYIGGGTADPTTGAPRAGTLSVAGITITGSEAAPGKLGIPGTPPTGVGGGILTTVGGTINVTDSTIADNTTSASGTTLTALVGGGIVSVSSGDVPATITVTDSTFRGNTIRGGSRLTFGGGIFTERSDIHVTGSTFTGNDVVGFSEDATVGGGIVQSIAAQAAPSLSVTDSTFSGNNVSGSGVSTTGGGIITAGGATIEASTFARNIVSDAGQHSVAAGVVAPGTGTETGTDTVTLTASLFAGNGQDCVTSLPGTDATGTFVDAGYNIDGDGTCGFTAAAHSISDSAGLAATLGALAQNGGPTETIAPLHDSPAVGMIPAGTSVSLDGHAVTLCPTTDQRGTASGPGKACNAGSVQGTQALPAAHVTAKAGDGQTAQGGTDFATRLAAAVTDSAGDPVGAGTTVTFSVTSGSATFAGAPSATATTGPNGVATAPVLRAGTGAGTVTVTAAVTGVAGPAIFHEIVTPAACTSNPFRDVSPTDPNCAYINWMVEKGITTGYPDHTYRPDYPVTRQTMAAFLYRLEHDGSQAPACTTAPFADVPVSNPFCGAISWLVDQGAAQGYADHTFGPTQSVTKQTMAALTYRLRHGGDDAPACTSAPFADVPASSQFCGAIAWAAGEGILTGTGAGPAGDFQPLQVVTRGSAAPVLFRFDILPAAA